MNAGRTITLATTDRGMVRIPEPGWCRGHEGEPPQRFTDLTHHSIPARAAGILTVHLSQAPYLVGSPERQPIVSVVLDYHQDLRAEQMPELYEALRSVQRVLSFAAAEAIRLRGEL
ncbi:hypothetical protein [Streptomyces sp. NPDC005385]|uniref:DUF6907 domain-containing protein n=1 Tax=Streptomyces sp. NPDC005385 TaxID=3157039 RepID=UPI0033B2CC6E